jgi:hypothetical protein
VRGEREVRGDRFNPRAALTETIHAVAINDVGLSRPARVELAGPRAVREWSVKPEEQWAPASLTANRGQAVPGVCGRAAGRRPGPDRPGLGRARSATGADRRFSRSRPHSATTDPVPPL